MKTTSEILQEYLLTGNHLTKFDFLKLTNSVCLAQRVLELRQMGWNIRDKAVKGKGNLCEYWLEPEEIARIKNKAIREPKQADEQSFTEPKNIAENEPKKAVNETYEQIGLGLLGTSNYGVH